MMKQNPLLHFKAVAPDALKANSAQWLVITVISKLAPFDGRIISQIPVIYLLVLLLSVDVT